MAKKSPTAKQRCFVEEYLLDLNATQAAIRAGYSEKTAGKIGTENLQKPVIASAIQEAVQKRSERTEITASRVLSEYARIAFADIRSVATWDKDGVRFTASGEISDDAAAAIEEVSQTTRQLDDGGYTSTKRVKLASKLKALSDIARHLGMFIDRKEVTGASGGPIEVIEVTFDIDRS